MTEMVTERCLGRSKNEHLPNETPGTVEKTPSCFQLLSYLFGLWKVIACKLKFELSDCNYFFFLVASLAQQGGRHVEPIWNLLKDLLVQFVFQCQNMS